MARVVLSIATIATVLLGSFRGAEGAAPSGSWKTITSVPTPRYGLGVTTGADGRIYAIGGVGRSGVLRTVEAYSVARNVWTALAPLSSPRAYLAVTRGPDGRIYALGGERGKQPVDTVEAYSLASKSWSQVARMPTARDTLAAVTGLDGRIYAIGGCCDAHLNPFSRVEAYTPATNKWTTVASLPTARRGLAAVVGQDGLIYTLGGDSATIGSVVRRVEAYDPRTNTWTCSAGDTSAGCASTGLKPMPTAREGLAAVTGPDGMIYAIGGGEDNSHTVLKKVEAYNPATNTWSAVASLRTYRSYLGAAVVPDGRIIAVGGSGYGQPPKKVEAYSPTASSNPAPRIPIDARLSAHSVRRGDQEQITLQTAAGARLVMQVTYAQTGGFTKRGTADGQGRWQHSWKVNAQDAGPASVHLLVVHGQDRRSYTLHFTVT